MILRNIQRVNSLVQRERGWADLGFDQHDTPDVNLTPLSYTIPYTLPVAMMLDPPANHRPHPNCYCCYCLS